MAPLRPLNHWMLQDDRIAREFDGILKLSPYYDPLRLAGIQSKISFFASLTADVNSPVGQNNGQFLRNSEGVYRAPLGTMFAIAADDVSRHEYSESGEARGILMEAAITNKCINYNANPDAALSNHTVIGDGIFSRVQDAEILDASGLSQLCTSGFVFKADNINGSGNLTIWVNGSVGNTNEHTCSAFARKDPASIGGGTFLQLEGAGNVEFTNTALYERIVLTETPIGIGNQLGIIVQPGAIAYFVLNQLEQSNIASSVIITVGEAASRSLETLFWSTVDINGDPVINQPEGMAAVLWRPQAGDAEIDGGVTTLSIVRTEDPATAVIFFRRESGASTFRSRNDNGQDRQIAIAGGLQKNQDYLLLLNWGAGLNQVGYKHAGVTRWSAQGSYTGYSGASFQVCNFVNSTADVPQHAKDVYFWSENKGTDWLEQFFAGVAN